MVALDDFEGTNNAVCWWPPAHEECDADSDVVSISSSPTVVPQEPPRALAAVTRGKRLRVGTKSGSRASGRRWGSRGGGEWFWGGQEANPCCSRGADNTTTLGLVPKQFARVSAREGNFGKGGEGGGESAAVHIMVISSLFLSLRPFVSLSVCVSVSVPLQRVCVLCFFCVPVLVRVQLSACSRC